MRFSGYYEPAQTPGITTVEYCFYDEIDPTDNTCLIITYDVGSTSSLNEINKMISDFYPNPSIEMVYVDYFSDKPAELIVMDVLGNKVNELKLSSRGVQKIDVSDFEEGIYFANLIVNSESVTIKKIIVR